MFSSRAAHVVALTVLLTVTACKKSPKLFGNVGDITLTNDGRVIVGVFTVPNAKLSWVETGATAIAGPNGAGALDAPYAQATAKGSTITIQFEADGKSVTATGVTPPPPPAAKPLALETTAVGVQLSADVSGKRCAIYTRQVSTWEELAIRNCPVGTSIDIGNGFFKRDKIDQETPFPDTKLDFDAQFEQVPLAELLSYKATLPITVTLPDGKVLEGKINLGGGLARAFTTKLATVKKGPVKFANEGSGKLFYPLGPYPEGARVGDIGFIEHRETTRREKSCGTYKSASGATASAMLVHEDWDISIYERRTGKRLANKFFKARDTVSCSSTITSQRVYQDMPDGDAVQAWLKANAPK